MWGQSWKYEQSFGCMKEEEEEGSVGFGIVDKKIFFFFFFFLSLFGYQDEVTQNTGWIICPVPVQDFK